MKRILFVLTAFICLSVASFAQNGGNDNQIVGRAIGAYNSSCHGDYNGSVRGEVEVTGICFVSGFLRRVVIYPNINCNSVDCQTIRYAPLGSVYFDCEDNIISVDCDWP